MIVLITRPAPEGETLCQQLNAGGFQTLWLPTLIFAPPNNPPVLNALNTYDWLIFISPQSVRYGLPHLPATLPATCRIAAIGKATARLLTSRGMSVSACPETSGASDTLLALPHFQTVAQQRIALIKGEGGRKHLSQTLTARGAAVTEINVYQRQLPASAALMETITALQQTKIDATVITSGESLMNLLKLTGKNTWPLLQQAPLVVISPRLQRLAGRLGFCQIFLAADPHGDAIMTALKAIHMTGKRA